MFEPHPQLALPGKRSKIWRFLDFTKFVSMLESRSLYFSRVDQLGDPWEGAFPKNIIEAWRRASPSADKHLKFHYDMRMESFANCWHVNSHESAAMWKQYTASHESIAIESTVERLQNSLAAAKESVLMGLVRYINYSRPVLLKFMTNVFFPVIHKRKSFEHERELRAIIWKPLARRRIGKRLRGFHVNVDLEVLVSRIHVAPACERWFPALVRGVLARYALPNAQVMKSSIDSAFTL